MEENWFNLDPDDGFNPEHHDVEIDEIAKLYAMSDMKEKQYDWARAQADAYYADFSNIDVNVAISSILAMIKTKELILTSVNTMLDNMITLFQETEEYEKCQVCLQIKTGINDTI
jgi:hypothetical protein